MSAIFRGDDKAHGPSLPVNWLLVSVEKGVCSSYTYGMLNWKAILSGAIVIVLLGLFMQLLLAVTPMLYTWVSGHSMLDSRYSDSVFLAVGLLGFILTLVSGGIVVGYVAGKPAYLEAAVAGGGVSGLSLLFSHGGGQTLYGVFFFSAGVLLAVSGAALCARVKVHPLH